MARILGQELTEALNQQFIIDNRPGAGAVIGTDIVAKAAPDGYTLLMMSNTHTTNETLLDNKPYVLMRDLVAVAPVNSSDLVMVVHPSVKAKTLQEFIALAKGRPGQAHLRLVGPRHALPHGRRAVQSHERHGHPARASQEQQRRAQRRDGRPCPDDVRRRDRDEGQHRCRPGPGAGDDGARSARPCCPTCRR